MIDKIKKENNEFIVLARKYRPQTFSELIGQDVLVQALSNAFKLNKLAHAFLLTGVRGIGKTTTARIIARTINCENLNPNNFESCNKCDSCKSIYNESNMDVLEMDAASRTGVDDVREIIDNVKYKPVSLKYKIFIIDEVHMLSKSAFNALLKTLEEPPLHVKFIFATTEVKKIPITILSRCQRFDLQRINNKTLTEHLNKISKIEKISISNESISLIVRAADGSARDALSLLDQANILSSDKIEKENILDMLGIADRGKIYDLLDNIFSGDAPKSLQSFKTLYDQGADILLIFEEMLKVSHFLTELKILPSIADDPYIPELEKTKGLEMSKKLTISKLSRFWQVLFKGYQELQDSNYLLQTSEMIIIRLIFLSDFPPPSELIKKAEKEINENLISNKVNNEELKENKIINYSNENNEITDEDTNIIVKKIASFGEFVELFHQYREGLLFTKLYHKVRLISFEEGKIIINIDSIKEPDFLRIISKLALKWTGRIWNITSSSSKIGNTLEEQEIINHKKKIEETKKDPEIKKILELFPCSSIHYIEEMNLKNDKKNESEIQKIIKGEK